MERKPLDPNMTIHVNNDELEQMLTTYSTNKTPDTFNKLIRQLVTCRVLLPGTMDSKINKPVPCMIKTGEGLIFLPVYTSFRHVQKAPKSQAIMNMHYLHVNGMVLNTKSKVNGIVINPFSDNIILKPELIKKIAEVEEQKKAGIGQKNMTSEQYPIFERMNFERRFLPKQLFQDGQAFFDKLEQKREAFLDELYEESYQNKRMYPYLEEDFSLMLLNISEELTVARIEFPTKDLAPQVALRGFISWNKKTQKGRYFMIEQGKESNARVFSEITHQLKYVNYGLAPVDGMELQRVLDLVQTAPGLTS